MEPPQHTVDMLRVYMPSGEMLVAVPVEELSTVKALKQKVQSIGGLPRFRQRLLHGGTVLKDDFRLESPLDLQLVVLNYVAASDAQGNELVGACASGTEAGVEAILDRPQDPNRLSGFGPLLVGPLQLASMMGRVDNMRLLLEARAELDGVSDSPFYSPRVTALSGAAEQGRVDAVRLLLAARADAEIRSCGHGRTALWLASYTGRSRVVRLLLEAGAEKEAADNVGMTPLGAACSMGRFRVVRSLLAASASVSARDRDAVLKAHVRGRLQILRLLSKHRWSRTRFTRDPARQDAVVHERRLQLLEDGSI
ncbi:caiap [Symbiodinium pilosum]|uniref:Caiap protein n=1 Tax=Symbiodinium pilosum TaxID=2952 RepID=A0A812MLL2_SYMPI|nr:caiap [Symbiodinium pilosum]